MSNNLKYQILGLIVMNKFKICFFDMEGTIFKKNKELDNGKVAPSAWTVLAKKISLECYKEEELTKDKWLLGEYGSYTQWMRDTIEIQIKHKMLKKHLEEVLIETEFQNGIDELFAHLKSHNMVTTLISGGFKALADIAQTKLKIDHAYSACEYFFDQNGTAQSFNLLPTDEDGKLVFMTHLANEYNCSLKECIFIGDGKNDVKLAKECGLSIAFNAQPELEKVSTYKIKQHEEDMREIIKYLN